jgi:hypothetical protein
LRFDPYVYLVDTVTLVRALKRQSGTLV